MKNNPIKFKVGFFTSLSKVKLKPSEYDCLMVLLEGIELTTTQVRELLGISVEVSCRALLRLNKLGIITDPNFCVDDDYNINKLMLD